MSNEHNSDLDPSVFVKVFALDPEGAKILGLLKRLYYDGNLHSENPNTTSFNLGRREVVKFLINKIQQGEQQ